jgi:hypothetical protein
MNKPQYSQGNTIKVITDDPEEDHGLLQSIESRYCRTANPTMAALVIFYRGFC